MQYRHVLVPVDFNDPDQLTIETALALAAQHHAQTTLMYVIEAIDEDDGEDGLDDFYAELEVPIRSRMAALAERFRHAGLAVTSEIVVGHRPREIVQYSASKSVDLIVMRSQRVDLNRPYATVASVSHQVSMFCQCPVMLVK